MPRYGSSFRPNPDRGVFLNDLVGPEILKKLTPEILALKAKSDEPITLCVGGMGRSICGIARECGGGGPYACCKFRLNYLLMDRF